MSLFRAWNGAWLEARQRPLGPHDGKARAGSRDDGAAPPRRPGFIAHYSKGLTPFANPKHTNHGGQSSRMGAAQGMTRIGINYDIVAPGKRTSRPHAESAEDEFVLVLKGRPDAWIDGHLHQLGEGDAAVFPAGTGIAHSFLNNSDEDVHLLVIGEHARAGNRLNYPLNPERMAEFEKLGRAWLDAPKHELGPHDGMARAGTRRG
ncbi:MAG: cupin domain-containing protein [Rhizobiales bacterium]|nr:cupin domain-containing protein [Hyphomicrobiales bacterium]